MVELGITSYLFGKIADFSIGSLLDNFDFKEENDKRKLEEFIEDYKSKISQRHKENPDFEQIEKFWKENQVVENLIDIRYFQKGKYKSYNEFISDLQEKNYEMNSDLCFSLMDQFNEELKLAIEHISNFSKADIASMNNLPVLENMENKLTEMSSIIESTYSEILTNLEEFGKKNEIKTKKQLKYIQESRIDNIHFTHPISSKINITMRGDYKYNYYLFNSFAFEGNFGSNPTAYLIYSKDDGPIQIHTSEQGLQPDNLLVLKFENPQIIGNKYLYKIQKEYCYYSNQSVYDIRPFILVILGENSMGFVTLTVINKTMKQGNSYVLPFTGTNQFIPQARILVWPNAKDLLKKLPEPQTKRSFFLDKSVVDDVIAIKKEFLFALKQDVREVLQSEYE
ncbi:hypothetical protein [Streptococcus suis]|uniref:Uncharacterized protein n=1 Tax=Streptococcus suis TaxID=1307 RepID=A0A0Z8EXF6_STRSU|nr:hypothetical protein [Streptococcus suis]NQH22495.1 hypothetical protein [Streptococcus suis]NQH62893.1 hypothetical protein [Streptococcus suis]NQN38298.1 hypothetical protein [Streptococcus suis]NQP21688.1 hypothetical protein [Streptococcus suis]NQS05082.1 hypothetical protein [Streptococcus suis]